jgi:hypothetical protein
LRLSTFQCSWCSPGANAVSAIVLINFPFISKTLTDTFCDVGSENEMVVDDVVGLEIQ